MKRQDVVYVLKNLLPLYRESEAYYEGLADHSSDALLKAVYIRYWQKLARCVCELEDKIRSHGGEIELTPESPLPVAQQPAWSPLEFALSDSLPVDVQMLLKRHILIYKEAQKRTASLNPSTQRTEPLMPGLLNAQTI